MYRSVGFCFIVVVVIAHGKSNPTNPTGIEPVVMLNMNSVLDILEDQSLEFSSSKLIAVPATQFENTISYNFGKRIPNDRIVSQHKDTHHGSLAENVILILQYPLKGKGAIVTSVEVVVDQSSNIGRATIIAGGIGQRFIATIVEGNSTYWFNYSARIYGLDAKK